MAYELDYVLADGFGIAQAPSPTELENMMIDDLAGVCAHWERNRAKGITPYALRRCIMDIAKDLTQDGHHK